MIERSILLGGLGTVRAVFDRGEWRFTGTIHATADAPEQSMWASSRKVETGYEALEAPNAKPRRFKRAD